MRKVKTINHEEKVIVEKSCDRYYDGPVIVRDIPFEQLLEEIRLEEERCKTLTSWDECM